jgi:hypothetical protein
VEIAWVFSAAGTVRGTGVRAIETVAGLSNWLPVVIEHRGSSRASVG